MIAGQLQNSEKCLHHPDADIFSLYIMFSLSFFSIFLYVRSGIDPHQLLKKIKALFLSSESLNFHMQIAGFDPSGNLDYAVQEQGDHGRNENTGDDESEQALNALNSHNV